MLPGRAGVTISSVRPLFSFRGAPWEWRRAAVCARRAWCVSCFSFARIAPAILTYDCRAKPVE